MAYDEPTGINKILVEKYGYEWVNGKAWKPGTAPEPEIIPEDEPVAATPPEPSQPEETPIEEPSASGPISLEEKIEQLQASLNELQKKYEEALAKLEQANARIAELEGQQSEPSSDVSDADDTAVEPEETPAAGPQQPAETDEVDAVTPETPEVTAPEPEPTPQPSYPEPTGVNKILVEKYGYEWVNGKAWKPGTAPEPELENATEPTEAISEDDTSDTEVPQEKSVVFTYSQKMDFSSISEELVVPPNYEMNWLGNKQYGASEYFFAIMMSPNVIHMPSQEDSDVIVLPSWYAYEPFLPAISLQIDEDDIVSLASINDTTTVGWARNWEEIDVGGKTMMVIADTGHELASGYSNWNFGDVWLADVSGTGQFELSAISDINAFYHDIDVGDINGDGLDDILAIHMSVKDGADPHDLHIFYQEEGGTFAQQIGFMNFTNELAKLGGASGGLADLNNDGSLEIIQAAYTKRDFPNWDMDHIFRVYGKDEDGEYSLQFSAPRSGSAANMGTGNVYDADIDNDGDLDLMLYMEGLGKQGIQIWENIGDSKFAEVTDEWLDFNVWSNNDFSVRDFTIADVNGDGYQDVFLNGFGPNQFQDSGKLNLGSYIFLNNGGTGFDHLTEVSDLIVDASSGKQVSHLRLYQVEDDSFEVLLTNFDGTFGIVDVGFANFDGLIT